MSGSGTAVTATRQGVLLAMTWLVLALFLAFPAGVLVASTEGAATRVPAAPAQTLDGHGAHEPPCHHDRVASAEKSTVDPHHDHGSEIHHTSGGCCPMSLCVGTCASACPGAGAGAVLALTLSASVRGDGGPRPVRQRLDVLSGTQGAPYRPPIDLPAIVG